MSNLAITVERIDRIQPHPHADRLEIVHVLGTQCIVGQGDHCVGDLVFYFPPGMLLPLEWSEKLGVRKYLKHSWLKGEKIQCRVAACRLRGIPSYGFVSGGVGPVPIGTDMTYVFDAEQYVPPLPPGDQAPGHDDFECYTNIQNFWQYPNAIPEGMLVRITEKLHGTNSRVGVVQVGGEWQFMAGSHNVCWKQPSRYWEPLTYENVLRMINVLCDEQHPVTVYGEIFGPGVQDMDYGLSAPGYRVFDIKVAGKFLSLEEFLDATVFFSIATVPELYRGPFHKSMVEEYTSGVSSTILL